MFQVRDDENLKEDHDNDIGPPVATGIAVKSDHGPNRPPHGSRLCHAHFSGLRVYSYFLSWDPAHLPQTGVYMS